MKNEFLASIERAVLHDLRLGVQHLFVGALEAAGLDELARRVSTHHHVHALTDAEAAPSAPTTAPLAVVE